MKFSAHLKALFPWPIPRLTGVLALGALVLAGGANLSAQVVTNAYDEAIDPAYAGAGAPNGLYPGGQNGGYGFGAWIFNETGNGGAFIQTYGPSGASFDLWNVSANSSTVAIRPLNTPLSAGDSFLVKLRLNSLDNNGTTNQFALEDAEGNILFSYWHWGNEPNGAVNGWYSDATNPNGVATNFSYAYQQFVTYKFTLNSATTYTFTDQGTGASFTGSISNAAIAQVAFIRVNGSAAPGNGQDYQFDQLTVISATPPSFQAVSPGADALSVATNATISLDVASGGVPLNLNSVSLTLDGNAVTPGVTGNSSLLSISYTPAAAFAYETTHTVQVVIQDNNTASYTNTWSFTTGHANLPVTLAGPFTTGGGNDFTIMTATGEGWLGANYDTNSTRTLYTRYSMVFTDLNGETGSGGGYGGLNFIQDNAHRMLAGNGWQSLNWSIDDGMGQGNSQQDLTPATPVVLGEWHTIVERVDYVPNGNDSVKIWLDPDFSKPEEAQANVFSWSSDNSFNKVQLRCGNGTASATWTNIIMGAHPTDVGFPPTVAPQFQAQTPAAGAFDIAATTALSAQVVAGGYPIQSVSLSIDGGPAVTPTTNQVSVSILGVSYQPPTALSYGAMHTVQLVVTDANNSSFTNTWSFTTGFAALPLTLAGPFAASNNVDNIIFTATNDPWIGTNYQGGLSKTLYLRFSAAFTKANDSGATWGGLEFYQNNNERLLTAKGGASANWSVAAAVPDTDIPPTIPFATNEWHVFVVRADYAAGGGNTAVKVWLDPDFSQTEANQPVAPLDLSFDNTFDNIRLRAGFAPATALYSNIMVAATPAGVGFQPAVEATFQNYVPAANASSAPVGTPVGVEVLFGSYGIATNAVTLTLDGNVVAPSFTVGTNSLGISYQPGTPFAPGTAHTVEVNLTDLNGTPYYTSWSFTADAYPTLPVSMDGPFDVYEGTSVTLWNSQNGWLGGGYGPNATGTLYTRFSMAFIDYPQTDANAGGSFGGLQFFQDNTERLITGNSWTSTNWSFDAKESGQKDMAPATPIVAGEWHTFVIKSVYASNAPTAVSIWLDPDFSQTLENQPQAPTTTSLNNTFNQIRVRSGNGSTFAEFTNIVVAAAVTDLGFPPSVTPGLLSIQNGQLSWTGGGTLQAAPAVTGPWTNAVNQTNPQALAPTRQAEFYRLQQ
ncbi:MAG TPA: Ig-like domain-containing protein [Dongiaceae bacterium]|nr:Ig-like domain-containing protein [Dongiaceae bacterium]